MTESSAFTPPASRIGLERSLWILPLPFRRLIVRIYRTMTVVWLLTIVAVFGKWFGSARGEPLQFWMDALIAASLMKIVAGFLVRWSLTRFDVCRDGVTVDRGDGRRARWYPFTSFTKIRFAHLSGGLAFCTLTMKDGSVLRVPSFLQRSDYVLDLLAAARGDLAAAPGFDAYRRTAIAIDHGWARQAQRVEHWPTWLWFVSARTLFSVALAYAILWWRSESFQWELACRVTLYALVALTVWEGLGELWQTRLTMGRLKADAAAVRRDGGSEHALRRLVSVTSWAIMIFVALFVSAG